MFLHTHKQLRAISVTPVKPFLLRAHSHSFFPTRQVFQAVEFNRKTAALENSTKMSLREPGTAASTGAACKNPPK